jgi:hypothetical protein
MSDHLEGSDRQPACDDLRFVHAVLDAVDLIFVSRFVAIAILCLGIERAHASCAVALEGDPAVVEVVRAELAEFADDSAACLTLWVQCRKASDQLEIDLHDELGRSSLRLFASARGAAAFIISWSRRPLSMQTTAIERAARPAPQPPVASATSLAGSQDQPWHLEVSVGAVAASGVHTLWAVTSAALVRRTSIFRYGGALRMMTGWSLGNLVGEATANFGVADTTSEQLTASAELVVGGTVHGDHGDSPSTGVDYGADGVRAGVRAAVDRRLTASLELELGAGFDVVRQIDFPGPSFAPSVDYQLCMHLGAGLRWTP